jgi:hypothetical protein
MFSGPVASALRAELEVASERHEKARLEFWRVSADIPSGLPHPDGTSQIHGAARAHMEAMKAHYVALQRWNDYALNGTVPEDMTGKS